MTTTAVSLLVIGGIAAYVVFVSFILALLTSARRADEAAENDRFLDRNGELGHGGVTSGDVQFLHPLRWRAAHQLESLRRRARPPAG